MSQPKILCPTDFSESSLFALQQAAIHARASGATLVIVHVQEVYDVTSGEGMLHGGLQSESPRQLRDRLKAVVPGDDVAYEHHLLQGKPAQEILRYAEAEKIGMIFMGTHGRTGLSRLTMGSVAEKVLRKATCNVVVLKAARE